MSLIDSKWKSCILDELRDAAMRPSELHKALPEATPRVLDLQLKELADDGLVAKTIYPELPPRSEYAITELGRSLLPILDAMIAWERPIGRCSRRNTGPEYCLSMSGRWRHSRTGRAGIRARGGCLLCNSWKAGHFR